MNNNLTVFNNLEMNVNVRAMEIKGDVWFVGKDIAEALGYKDTDQALRKHIDGEDKIKWHITDSLGRMQQTTIINESGMYALVLGSKLESAKKFKRWVTSEVIQMVINNNLQSYALQGVVLWIYSISYLKMNISKKWTS